MKDKVTIIEKVIWAIYIIPFILACGTAGAMDDWLGYTYLISIGIAVFVDDFKIIKGNWVRFIPIPLTILYLLYEHELALYILKNIFNRQVEQ